MSNELFDVFLYLRSKLLIVTDEQLQQLTNEPEHSIQRSLTTYTPVLTAIFQVNPAKRVANLQSPIVLIV